MIERRISSTGEMLPVIGLGTWQTFDVSSERQKRVLAEILRAFSSAGGKVIDSSPMYGRAEEVVGELKENVDRPFLAAKVWTRGRKHGISQMETSMRLFRTSRIDLMQIHNLVDWRTHLDTLRGWKHRQRIRYIGVTHYQTGAFPELASIMRQEAVDFVQLPYSITLAEAEKVLLPLAADRGIGVVVNRPFEGGTIFRDVRSKPLPRWAAEFDARSWGELFLRYILSHPAVTCVIPATRDLTHMHENLRAGEGRTLSEQERQLLRKRVLELAG